MIGYPPPSGFAGLNPVVSNSVRVANCAEPKTLVKSVENRLVTYKIDRKKYDARKGAPTLAARKDEHLEPWCNGRTVAFGAISRRSIRLGSILET